MQRTHNPVERPKTREGNAPTNYHAKIAQPCWEGWLWGACVWHISAWESANGYWNWHCVPYNPSSRQWMHFLLIVFFAHTHAFFAHWLYCPHSFSLSTTHHGYCISRIGVLLLLLPLCFSWDIQVKFPFTKAKPWATLPPGLEAHFYVAVYLCLPRTSWESYE